MSNAGRGLGVIGLADNSVSFKANANGLVVVFDKSESFDSICEQISRRLESGGFFFQTRYLAVTYKGRKLSSEEEGKISRLMAGKTGARTVLFEIDKDFERELKRSERMRQGGKREAINIPGHDIMSGADEDELPGAAVESSISDIAAIDDAPGDAPADDTSDAAPAKASNAAATIRRRYAPMDLDECMTKYYRGTLRSGRLISYDGNVVVIGDVNPGAEVEATGNIIILGNVRGVVHAGAGGNKEASVIALNFAPTQLRVADIITRKAERHGRAAAGNSPEIAYLKGDSIIIEPLT